MNPKIHAQRSRIGVLAAFALLIASLGLAFSGSAGATNTALAPFNSSSVWNQPVAGIQHTFESGTGPMTQTLRQTSGIQTWANIYDYSHPIYEASATDPLVTVTDTVHPWVGPYQVRVPAGATPAEGTDAHLHVVTPDKTEILETFAWQWTSATTANVQRMHKVSLTGSGVGPQNGTRAYGGSAIGGLIRTWEVDPANPNYVDGVIRHPLALALPRSMLRYTSGTAGYDGNGYGTELGYVWPATEQDFGSQSTYGTGSNKIPMGSFLRIPASVDVNSLGLNPQVKAIAKAAQDYGVYVTDATGPGTVSFYAEPTVPQSWQQSVLNYPFWDASGLETIRQNLVVANSVTIPSSTTSTTAAPTTTSSAPTTTTTAPAGTLTLYRAVNVNGAALTAIPAPTGSGTINFESGSAANFAVNTQSFCNQSQTLSPATGNNNMSTMLRCSVWGNGNVAFAQMNAVPAGNYKVYFYTWEDNDSANVSIAVNGTTVVNNEASGPAGAWKLRGPYTVNRATSGPITVSGVNGSGDLNISGMVVYKVTTPPSTTTTTAAPTTTTTAAPTTTTTAAPTTTTTAPPATCGVYVVWQNTTYCTGNVSNPSGGTYVPALNSTLYQGNKS